jgi:hypothetical protein
MKISFIGSSHLNFCADFFSNILNIDKFFLEFDEGISSFWENHKADLKFHNEISESNYVFIDLLADKDVADFDFQLIENKYQKLIWHIYSILEGDIIIVNFLKYNIDNLDGFISFLSSLRLKNCDFHCPHNNSYFFENRNDHMESIGRELLGEGLNTKRDNQEKVESNSELQDVINNLKLKKEFETKY